MAPNPLDRMLDPVLHRLGLAQGGALVDTRLTQAVRCAPPRNLPDPGEVRTCNQFLAAELASLPHLRAVLALGVLAHAAVLQACGIPPTRIRFTHGAIHELPDGLILADCHHLSAGDGSAHLSPEMLEATVLALLKRLETED
jgi:uracil-DNA glycosylase family 4